MTSGSPSASADRPSPFAKVFCDDQRGRPGHQEEEVDAAPAARQQPSRTRGSSSATARHPPLHDVEHDDHERATTSITVASAAAAAGCRPREARARGPRPPRCGMGRLPLSSTSEPYSLMPRAKDSAAPAKIAGARRGQHDRDAGWSRGWRPARPRPPRRRGPSPRAPAGPCGR